MKKKMFDLHFDEDVNMIFDNSIAKDYISKLKVGNIIEFTYKKDGRKNKNKNDNSLKGIVRYVHQNKFEISVKLKHRKETMMITANDIMDHSFEHISNSNGGLI